MSGTSWRRRSPGRWSTRSGRRPANLAVELAREGTGTAGGDGGERERLGGGKRVRMSPSPRYLPKKKSNRQDRIFRSELRPDNPAH